MKRWFLLVLLPALLFTTCTDQQHYDNMRQTLLQLQARNQADSLMTNDTLATTLVHYFDRHGTANDRMLAHYLLARTYADMGEAPHALDEYHAAADCADTTATDCNYRILARVHAQMSEIFSEQLLAEQQLMAIKQALHYSQIAKDTMMEIACTVGMSEAFEIRNQTDSALYFLNVAYQMHKNGGRNEYAAALLCSKANIYLQRCEYNAMKQCLEEYEHSSGFFYGGNIEKGREIYYYIKGSYFLNTNQYDSAAFYFRKELCFGHDAENQMAGNKGLYKLYIADHQKDSLLKYATLCDSISSVIHVAVEMEKTLQAESLYDYRQFEIRAMKEKQRAKETRLYAIIASLVCIVILLISSVLYYQLKQQLKKYTLEKRLQQSHIVKKLHEHALLSPPVQPSFEEWKELRMLVNREIPSFYNRLNTEKYQLTDMEYDVCLLIRVYMTPSEICKLKGCSSSYVSNLRSRLMKRIYGKTGSGTDLDRIIKKIV